MIDDYEKMSYITWSAMRSGSRSKGRKEGGRRRLLLYCTWMMLNHSKVEVSTERGSANGIC